MRLVPNQAGINEASGASSFFRLHNAARIYFFSKKKRSDQAVFGPIRGLCQRRAGNGLCRAT